MNKSIIGVGFVIVLLLLAMSGFSQTKVHTTDSTMTASSSAWVDTSSSQITSFTDTASLTWKTVYNDAKGALKGLGDALKVGSEHVYEILVRQQIINAIIDTVITVIWLIVLLSLIRVIKSIKSWGEDDFGPKGLLAIILGFVTLALTITFFCNISTLITGYLNPEYGALKDIMKMIHSTP